MLFFLQTEFALKKKREKMLLKPDQITLQIHQINTRIS